MKKSLSHKDMIYLIESIEDALESLKKKLKHKPVHKRVHMRGSGLSSKPQFLSSYPSENLNIVGGNEIVEPTLNPHTGVEEIPINEFAAYQQQLIEGYPPEHQIQDLSTVPYGEVADTVADLAELIPEVGPIIGLAKEAVNALLGIFYKPKSTIEQRLRSQGIDIFQDNLILTNPSYPEDDPKHFIILLPNGMTADGQDQARYSALIYYQKVLGTNVATWINRISQKERDYLFPKNEPQWPTIFGELATIHGHANPYLVTAKFAK